MVHDRGDLSLVLSRHFTLGFPATPPPLPLIGQLLPPTTTCTTTATSSPSPSTEAALHRTTADHLRYNCVTFEVATLVTSSQPPLDAPETEKAEKSPNEGLWATLAAKTQ
ncbi:hypothetical protein E2C01_002747 [Portunus trituberculatus]|uniref:Uncharacterized protein n=1 Tax=Portunus trituberculatus TaxID=210409 RepID=A0A5B7CM17_PORTR|nr:hypothetical protein [Portunus trituberculatus]